MLKRSVLIFLSLVSSAVIAHSGLDSFLFNLDDQSFILNPVYAQGANREETDAYCKNNLNGSASKESCVAACTTPGYQCFLARKYSASEDPDIKEDVECFGCRKPICEDFGRLGAAAKARCDARPDYRSVAAAPLPDGTPCWTCEEIPDECKDKWPGTTVKATCEATCKDPARICAKLGHYKGNDCYACIPKKNPKPPKVCSDLGAITAAQCGTCPADTNCVPVGFRDGTGRICFKCEPKPKACRDIGKTNASICNACRRDGGKCLADGRAPNGEFCYKCEDRKCKDIGKKDRSICRQCRADGNRCVIDGRSPSGEPCYQCKNLKSCKDERKTNKDVCATCSEDEVCRYVSSAENGERCYRCKPKPKETCQDKKLLSDWDCETCEDDPDTKCVEAGKTRGGEQCYQCVQKTGCEKEDIPKGDCPANCSENERCVPKTVDGEQCHECVEKQCSDYGHKDSCAEDEQCDPVSPGGELQCCDCVKKEEPPETPPPPPPQCDLEKGERPGACPQECSADQECQGVYGKNCYKCVPKKKKCGEINPELFYQEDCGACLMYGGECNPTIQDDWGVRCFECIFDDQVDACREKDWNTGNCPGTCKVGQKCVPHSIPVKDPVIKAWQCHECVTEEKICADEGYTNSCPAGQECIKVTTRDGLPCCDCKSPTPPLLPCPTGAQHGTCIPIDPCQPGKTCVDRSTEGADCYECRSRPMTGGDQIFTDGFESGDTSAWTTSGSKPIPTKTPVKETPSSIISLPTGSGLLEAKDEFCDEEMGGYAYSDCLGDCPQQDCVRDGTALLFDLGAVTCYYCRRPSVDNRPIIHLPDGRVMRVNTIEITYLVIIIETPFGRVILGKEAGPLADFEPESIMALAQYDPSMGSLESLLGGVSNAAATPLEIASKLTDALQNQRFIDKFFDAFNPRPVRQSPPSGTNLGQTDKNNIPVSGPVIVSGKMKRQPALAIFDSGGAFAGIIDKKDLKKNPNIVWETLAAAGHASQRYMAMPVETKVESTDTTSMARPYKAKKKRKKKNTEEIVPNDPLYSRGDKKRRARPKISLGSSLKIGGVALGGGSRNDGPDVRDQWGLREIGFTPKSDEESAWNVVDGSQKNILVAVIDSGMDMTHPDGPQYVWKNPGEIPDNDVDDDANGFVDDVHGWNFVENNNDLTDLKGHGTFVAGIIAAKTNNGIGIAGINPGAVIMPLRVADKYGQTDSLRIFRAIQYAVTKGARVINISLGGRGISRLEELAIASARGKGVFIAISSGNEGENLAGYGPSSSGEALAVGAIDYEGPRSAISNWGVNNGLLAPGEKIYSIYSKDSSWEGPSGDRERLYYTQSGTSFSSPMAAGTASLLLVKDPRLTSEQIEDILVGTASDMDDEGWDAETGAGLLDAAAALRADPRHLINVKITGLRVNYDEESRRKNDVMSLDVFGTVRGNFASFTVEVGRGKRASRFEKVAGPLKQQAGNAWIARVDKSQLRGSDDWIVRISVTDKKGKTRTAQSLVNLLE